MTGLIYNAVLVTPDEPERRGAIFIEGKRISGVYYGNPKRLPKAEWEHDANGAWLMPGFIDIHTHGAAGADISDPDPEAIVRVAKAKIAEGCTQFSPTTLTLPEEQLVTALQNIAAYDNRYSRIWGVHLEGPFISCECMGAQNPAYVRKPDIREVQRLKEVAPISQVTYAVEVEGGAEFGELLNREGIIASCGHSKATFAEFAGKRHGHVRHLTHFCNQMSPLHHRDIGLVGGGLLLDDVTIELICDKIHLCPEMIKLIFKTKPLEKIALITDSMRASHMPDGASTLGGLDVIVKDGQARLASNNALAGSVLRMNEALRNVYEITDIPLNQLIKTTSLNQATEQGRKGFGRITEGYFADLTLLQPRTFAVQAVVSLGLLQDYAQQKAAS